MIRLDVEIAARGIVSGRNQAKILIESGGVEVNGKLCVKPSASVSSDDMIEIVGEKLQYVSRGGLKLEKALNFFNIDLTNKVCADIGASTGGFTDCMLQNGAERVYAIDVGHGQLAQKLKNDSRVINIEGFNVRTLCGDTIGEKVDFISIDVSFISLTKIFTSVLSILKVDGELAVLIKPQFEAGPANIGKNGIVKSPSVHVSVLSQLCTYFSKNGCKVIDLVNSPIKGGDGNTEYLAYLKFNNQTGECKYFDYKQIVKEALGK